MRAHIFVYTLFSCSVSNSNRAWHGGGSPAICWMNISMNASLADTISTSLPWMTANFRHHPTCTLSSSALYWTAKVIVFKCKSGHGSLPHVKLSSNFSSFWRETKILEPRMQVQHSLKSLPPSPTPLEAPPLLPTCCLFSSHTDLLILVALNTPSAPGPVHKLFPLSLFLLNFHSSFRSLLRHHFLGEAFLGISEQDKFLHYMESWLHASCLEHCDCYNFKLPCLVFWLLSSP